MNNLLNLQACRRFISTSLNDAFRNKARKLKESSNAQSSKDNALKNTKASCNLDHNESITSYLDSKSYLKKLKSKIPSHYIVKTFRYHNSLYVIDKGVAGKIFETIQPYLQSQKGHIVEVNAGLGVLTTFLLKANLPRLRIYEGESTLYEELHVKIQKHKSKAKVFNANLLMLQAMTIRDRHDKENRVSSLFQDISPFDWEDDPVMTFIVPLGAPSFLLHIMYSIAFQSGICSYGRPDLFVIMPPETYIKFTGDSKKGILYRHKTVMFKLFFEPTLLLKVPDKAFVPWLIKNQKNTRSTYQPNKDDENSMFLVRLTARRDLFQDIPPHQLNAFWYFVKIMLAKRSAYLIATIEKLVPGSGVRLIARGYTIFTRCGTVTPQEYLELFKIFASLPEYEDSAFTADVNRFFSLITEPETMKTAKNKRKGGVLKEEEDDDDDYYDDDGDIECMGVESGTEQSEICDKKGD